jgi:hypothetical protein
MVLQSAARDIGSLGNHRRCRFAVTDGCNAFDSGIDQRFPGDLAAILGVRPLRRT